MGCPQILWISWDIGTGVWGQRSNVLAKLCDRSSLAVPSPRLLSSVSDSESVADDIEDPEGSSLSKWAVHVLAW